MSRTKILAYEVAYSCKGCSLKGCLLGFTSKVNQVGVKFKFFKTIVEEVVCVGPDTVTWHLSFWIKSYCDSVGHSCMKGCPYM